MAGSGVDLVSIIPTPNPINMRPPTDPKVALNPDHSVTSRLYKRKKNRPQHDGK